MTHNARHLMLCNCEKTMRIDADAIGSATGFASVSSHTNLCRRETANFEQALGQHGSDLCVACTQESALFAEIAEEAGASAPAFINIREQAGWTADKASTAPKMAALFEMAAVSSQSRLRTIESDGLCLLAGSGQQAIDAAIMLNQSLSVTLLLTGGIDDIILPDPLDFPVFRGKLVQASGSLGKFDVVVDGYAGLLPSSRRTLDFAMPRDGAKSRCSVIFDITGKPSLFPRHGGRDGYFRAEPGDNAGIFRAIIDASTMVGTFEKPLYVRYDASICAHERSKKTGCTKCLDNCPAGAIAPDGDAILIDHDICGGCGNCAAHCPTGAVRYDYPTEATLIRRLQRGAQAFVTAGGKAPVLLVHDEAHGTPLIAAMARFGRGLPAHVIPFAMHSASGLGHEIMTSAFAAGFESIAILCDPRKSGELDSLRQEIALTDSFCAASSMPQGRILLLEENDPDVVENALWTIKRGKGVAPALFDPLGGKREIARAAIGHLLARNKKLPEIVSLPQTAPYGAVNVNIDACTLCMACVSACPADALRDNTEKPQLRFVESACVQCGICAATCPESAIALEARYNTKPSAMQPVTLNEDEPALCTRCSTPFASAKMLDRVANTLGGKHWMFGTDDRVALLHMCESCRLEVLSEGGADPFAIAQRPRVRTTEDYLKEEADRKPLSSDDFLN